MSLKAIAQNCSIEVDVKFWQTPDFSSILLSALNLQYITGYYSGDLPICRNAKNKMQALIYSEF